MLACEGMACALLAVQHITVETAALASARLWGRPGPYLLAVCTLFVQPGPLQPRQLLPLAPAPPQPSATHLCDPLAPARP